MKPRFGSVACFVTFLLVAATTTASAADSGYSVLCKRTKERYQPLRAGSSKLFTLHNRSIRESRPAVGGYSNPTKPQDKSNSGISNPLNPMSQPRLSVSPNFFVAFGLPQKSPASYYLQKTETKRDGSKETQRGDHIRVGEGVGVGGSIRLDFSPLMGVRSTYNVIAKSFGMADVEYEDAKQDIRDKTKVSELSFELLIRLARPAHSGGNFYFGGGASRITADYFWKSTISLPGRKNLIFESFDYKLSPMWIPSFFIGVESYHRNGIFFLELKFLPARLRTNSIRGRYVGPFQTEDGITTLSAKYTINHDELVGPLAKFAETKTDHFKILFGYSIFLF